MVTDFDCWHPEHDDVEVSDIIKTLLANADKGKAMIKEITSTEGPIREICPYGCDRALEYAIISNADTIPDREKKRLGILTKRVFSK